MGTVSAGSNCPPGSKASATHGGPGSAGQVGRASVGLGSGCPALSSGPAWELGVLSPGLSLGGHQGWAGRQGGSCRQHRQVPRRGLLEPGTPTPSSPLYLPKAGAGEEFREGGFQSSAVTGEQLPPRASPPEPPAVGRPCGPGQEHQGCWGLLALGSKVARAGPAAGGGAVLTQPGALGAAPCNRP